MLNLFLGRWLFVRAIAVLWAIVGILAVFGGAIYRLGTKAWVLVDTPLTSFQWALLVFVVVFMAYSEGYKGFQKAYAPRVAARLKFLYENVTLKRAVFAPLFCMGFFDIQRRRQIATFILSAFIILMIFSLSMVSQPWRGIVDAGVVVGLSWGLAAIIGFCVQAFWAERFDYSPEMPEPA